MCASEALAQTPEDLCGPAVKVSGGLMRPLLFHKVEPDYGAVIRQTGVNGAVYFRMLIGCDGHVESVQIVSGPEALRQATMDAVKQWVYRPYFVSGRAVPVDLTMGISMNFGAAVLYEVISTNRVRVSSGVMAGQVLSKQNPVFPTLPPNAKVSGATVLHALIGKDGHVLELTVVLGPELIRSAVMDAVRQWHYRPFLVDGHPVEVETTITLNIDLGR